MRSQEYHLAQNHLIHSKHRINRRADLMGHVCKKAALGFCRSRRILTFHLHHLQQVIQTLLILPGHPLDKQILRLHKQHQSAADKHQQKKAKKLNRAVGAA